MRDPAEDAAVLEVHEPPVAVHVVDERALVGAVDRGGVLLEHDPVLVRPVQLPGAEDHLVAVGHSSRRRVDPVPAALPVGLGALESEHPGKVRAVDDHLRGGEGGGEIRRDLEQGEAVLHPGAGTGPAVHQVRAAVLVPQGARVDEPPPGQQQPRRAPRAGRVRRVEDEDAVVRIRVDDVERPGVLADARGPHAAAAPGEGVVLLGDQSGQRIGHVLPGHEVLRAQHGQARGAVEAGGDHPVVIAHPEDIRIGPIGVEDGVRTVLQLLSSNG